MSERPWSRCINSDDREWDSLVRFIQEAISRGLQIGADLQRIRACMEHCVVGMDWDQTWDEDSGKSPAFPPRCRIVRPPGTQLRLPLELPCEPEEPLARRSPPPPIERTSRRRGRPTAVLTQLGFDFQEAS
jgi:hypothetical protein